MHARLPADRRTACFAPAEQDGGGGAGSSGGDSVPPRAPDEDEPHETESARGARERKAFLLRVSPQVMAELRTWAAAEFRSVNAHIEYLLVEALRRRRDG